jgi:hypothetical protein
VDAAAFLHRFLLTETAAPIVNISRTQYKLYQITD